MELLSRVVLRGIEAYESVHISGPTASELAADLGIPPGPGQRRLIEHLHRQIVLGRVRYRGGCFELTVAGREALARDAPAARRRLAKTHHSRSG